MQTAARHRTLSTVSLVGLAVRMHSPLPPPFVPPASPAPPAAPGDFLTPGFFLELGFSFIVGLAIGFALKVAFKIALFFGGVLLIALFALQYADLIDIHWAGMEHHYNSLAAWLRAYGSGLKAFMAGNLPNAAAFTGGVLAGLRL